MQNNDKDAYNTLCNSPKYQLPKITFNEEWPGAKPLKFRSSIKIVPSLSKSQEQVFKAHKIQTKPPSSHERTYKPSIKIVPPFPQSTSISSKKFIIPKYSQPSAYQRFNLSSIIQPKVYKESSIKMVNVPEHLLHSREFTIDEVMTRKRKFYEKLNGSYMPKLNVEYSKGFYENGELIPGSSNRINLRKNNSILKQTIYDTMDISKKLLDNSKLWKCKSLNDIRQQDDNYVRNLEQIDKNIMKNNIQPPVIQTTIRKGRERKKTKKTTKQK